MLWQNPFVHVELNPQTDVSQAKTFYGKLSIGRLDE